MRYELCAGAVLYTVVGGVIHYVLVVESDGHCSLPKGHIETGETKKEAALREIAEETGITASLLDGFAMDVEYDVPSGNRKQTTYYVAAYRDQTIVCNRDELLQVKLLPFEAALAALTHPAIRHAFAQANKFIICIAENRST